MNNSIIRTFSLFLSFSPSTPANCRHATTYTLSSASLRRLTTGVLQAGRCNTEVNAPGHFRMPSQMRHRPLLHSPRRDPSYMIPPFHLQSGCFADCISGAPYIEAVPRVRENPQNEAWVSLKQQVWKWLWMPDGQFPHFGNQTSLYWPMYLNNVSNSGWSLPWFVSDERVLYV